MTASPFQHFICTQRIVQTHRRQSMCRVAINVVSVLLWIHFVCATEGARSLPVSLGVPNITPTQGRKGGRTNSGWSKIESGAHEDSTKAVALCASVTTTNMARTLLRGAFLRVASDLTGGTPLESIKCRVAMTTDGPIAATRKIIQDGGIGALWSGSESRALEGALMGAIFMLGSTVTKKQVMSMGGSPTMAALAAGLVGGVSQSIIMTPAGLIFTSLNLNRGKVGYENDNAISVVRRVVREKGIRGLYFGIGPMASRQATNWASRSCLTEIARSRLKLTRYGLIGEIGSGVLGGVCSCWNTPVETIRVMVQADVSAGRQPQSMAKYWKAVVDKRGYSGLYRGVTPRAVQAIWQTIFMVAVPNILGV